MRHRKLTDRTPLAEANLYMMIQRRAVAAGIRTKISAHSLRATGMTTYPQNGGKIEIAQRMAGHESAWTTGFYDRRNDSVALDEVRPWCIDHRLNSENISATGHPQPSPFLILVLLELSVLRLNH